MTTDGVREPWHALLAPLPPGVVPERKPVAPPELVGMAEGAPIAGWENMLVHLSAGAAGLRVVQVLLDERSQPISGSDHVLYRFESLATGSEQPREGAAQIRHESIGGRFEADGAFRGTCWLVTGPEPPDGEEPRWEMVPRDPNPDEVAALRALAMELLARDADATAG